MVHKLVKDCDNYLCPPGRPRGRVVLQLFLKTLARDASGEKILRDYEK